MPHILFVRSKYLEIKITEYLDIVNRGALTFKRDLNRYIKKDFSLFEEISQANDYVNKVHFFEHQADKNE